MAIKKYTNGSWVSASYRKYGTETNIITTLPATIIGGGTPISSYTIKGNMEQNGTPTPSSPIMPRGCGDLVASGEHAGQYKLPLALGSTTTDIYLGEVQSTRRIKKFVLTGEEDWHKRTYGGAIHTFEYNPGPRVMTGLCSHYAGILSANIDKVDGVYLTNTTAFIITDLRFTTITDFKAFLAAQYAAGTPVTVWYVIREPETAVVNEPIRKIGEYTDSVSGTNLATSGTAQELDVETTLKPSEVDLTYHGWHEHNDTKYNT